ncbi:hypothetical protein [uncultured Fibrobacter sp.]|uniref:hypothetical protein n=1 Tax=uncultured Fibrobacter sp. TaxID=261512 RepID=UPI00261BA5E2|nr:hypothetical protein [uncultured Fibrobacter sp.]
MTTIQKLLTIASLAAVAVFAQAQPADSASAAIDSSQTAVSDQTSVPADSATSNATTSDTTAAIQDSIATDSTVAAAADSAAPKKPRNKITYEEYLAKTKRNAKKRSKTLHHGLTLADASYNDKSYGHMHHDVDWGTGIGMYYFYRRYFGNYLGIQGRAGALYRYSRWNFDYSSTDGKTDAGEKYTLVHNIDRKYHNFALDMPLTGKFGYHIKGTTTYLYTGLTLGLTKPIYEMVDTENRLYLYTKDKKLQKELELIEAEGKNPFPVYESHQTKKFFYMDDWEFNSWIGLGIESRLVSIEFQMFAIGGTSQNTNHRYNHIGHDSHPTWRVFLDFSIR